jgi:flagellin-like hook-associated protein FlgL
MSNVILSNGIRQNLLSLQQTARQQGEIQNRLATGRKVNTAVDNPINFFTSAALHNRASQLNGLLDNMSNAVQTIQGASKGIDAITKLVKSAQSTIKQAQNDAAQNRPAKAGAALATQPEVIATSKSLKDLALDKAILDDNGATANTATPSYFGNLGGAAGSTTLAISVRAGANTYTASFPAANATLRDVVNEINKSGIATAFVDEKGQLNVKGTGSEKLEFGFGVGDATTAPAAAAIGTNNPLVGFLVTDGDAANDATDITSPGITSAVRSNLIQQFNELRDQIDKLAQDAGYNGLNLLGGDQLQVVFNEKTGRNRTTLNIQGTVLSAENLGIQKAGNIQLAGQINFQNDLDLDKAFASLTNATTSLQSLASTLGSNLSVVEARRDFTKEMNTILKTGGDQLVLADSNEEGANLLALNTRQQLSQTALSLASQADQGVLRLFG